MHKTLILEYLVYTERSYIPVAFSFQALKGSPETSAKTSIRRTTICSNALFLSMTSRIFVHFLVVLQQIMSIKNWSINN